jgi:hypothetical protein
MPFINNRFFAWVGRTKVVTLFEFEIFEKEKLCNFIIKQNQS